MIFKCDRW